MERLETFYTSVNAANVLDEYIHGIIYKDQYKCPDLLDPMINKCIKILAVEYIILSIKEEIIIKPKNATYTNNLLFSAIESLVGPLADFNDDGTLTVGGHKFDDANTLVAVVRNKFAHGDYTYSDDCNYVVFNFDGDNIPISLDALIAFAKDMLDKKYEYKITDEHVKPLGIVAGKKKMNKIGYASDEAMKEMLDDYVEYVFEISSSNGYISKEAFECFDKAKERLRKSAEYYRDSSKDIVEKKISAEVESFVRYFNEKSQNNNWDVTLSYKKRDLTEEDKLSIIDTFKKIKGGKPKYFDMVDELPYYATRSINNEFNRMIGVRRCSDFINILNIMLHANNSDMKYIGPYYSSTINASVKVDQDNFAMAQVLRLLSFSYMFENFDINYDCLPLDTLIPEIDLSEDTELRVAKEKVECTKRKLESSTELYDSVNQQINCVIDKNIPQDDKEKIIERIVPKYKVCRDKMVNAKAAYEIALREYELLQVDRNDNKKYYHNRRLLERMRDSISHGNVYVIPNGLIEDTIIRFEDKYNDQLMFAINVPLKDLIILLDEFTNALAREEVKMRKK